MILSDGETKGLQSECTIYWGQHKNHNFSDMATFLIWTIFEGENI